MSDEFSDWLASRADDTPEPLLRDGATVGDYTVVGFLGRGGSGEVYRAEHRLLKTPVALKVLHRGDDAGKVRFAREAEILFQHPCKGFPRFFAYGETEGRPYIATELLHERPLPTKEREVADFIRQVAAAVGELHKLGYVHRDIKPSNILWRSGGTRSCASAVPVLIDLGLAKPVSGTASPNLNTLSVDGGKPIGVGTPGYAAPEQFTGGDIGFSADIHALGVLANECFGGKPPKRWASIIDSATSSLQGRRFRTVDDLLTAIAVADRNVVLFRSVLATSAIPAVVCFILLCITLLIPLMPTDTRQSWFGSYSLLNALMLIAIYMAATSIIPLGLFKLKKWAAWLAIAEGFFLLLGMACIWYSSGGAWYRSLDTVSRFGCILWILPRIATFLLLLPPRIRSLFNR